MNRKERAARAEARMEKVVEMVNAGVPQKEMSAAVGVSKASITKMIQRARDTGRLPPRTPTKPQARVNNDLKKFDVTRGTVSQMLLLLPQEARDWVMDNTPPGASIAVFAASVLLDAYYDEVGD